MKSEMRIYQQLSEKGGFRLAFSDPPYPQERSHNPPKYRRYSSVNNIVAMQSSDDVHDADQYKRQYRYPKRSTSPTLHSCFVRVFEIAERHGHQHFTLNQSQAPR